MCLVSGEILHERYDNSENLSWRITTSCDTVRIFSTKFHTEYGQDILTIDGIEYHGTAAVNQIVPTNFTVNFTSSTYTAYPGFHLNWGCVELSWSEWGQSTDGLCNWERKKIYNESLSSVFGLEMQSLLEGATEYRQPHTSCRK